MEASLEYLPRFNDPRGYREENVRERAPTAKLLSPGFMRARDIKPLTRFSKEISKHSRSVHNDGPRCSFPGEYINRPRSARRGLFVRERGRTLLVVTRGTVGRKAADETSLDGRSTDFHRRRIFEIVVTTSVPMEIMEERISTNVLPVMADKLFENMIRALLRSNGSNNDLCNDIHQPSLPATRGTTPPPNTSNAHSAGPSLPACSLLQRESRSRNLLTGGSSVYRSIVRARSDQLP